MNRYGISQNPTTEESALLRKLWQRDDAIARANRLAADTDYTCGCDDHACPERHPARAALSKTS